MTTVKKRKKQAYLLLELLIAIAILSLFLAPMLRAPFGYLKRQRSEVTSLYLGLEGEKLLVEVEEDFRTGQIPWSKIISSQKEKVFIKSFSKDFFPDKTFPKVEVSIFLSKASLKKLETGTWLGKVQVIIEFSCPSDKNKIIHKVKSVFFVSKKKLEGSINPPTLSGVKDSLCRGGSHETAN